MRLTIEIELTEEQQQSYEQMIEDVLLSRDVFRTDCCGGWMCGLYCNEETKEWLVMIEDEADDDMEVVDGAILDHLAGQHYLPEGFKLWDRIKAERAMKYGISKHRLEDWLNGTASDAYAVDDAVQMAILGKIVHS